MKTNLIRKISIVLFFISFISFNSFSQGGYINLGLGYNLSAGKGVIGVNQTSSNTENVYGSFGKGVSIGGIAGYMFTEHVGAELGLSYLIGSEYEFTQAGGNFSEVIKEKGKMFRIIPAVKVAAGGAISPYAKFGVVLGVGAKEEITIVGSTQGLSYAETDKLSGGTAIGWMGAFGIDFKITDRVSIYGELNSINQTWAPDKNQWSATASTNGTSQTETATTTYVDNLPEPVSNSTVFGFALQALKDYKPFSSFGINAGIKLAFGK